MKIKIPNTWLGEPIEGAMEKALAVPEKNKKSEKRKTTIAVSHTDINDPQNWLILEGRQHGSYSYNDLVVSMHRLGYNSVVEKTARDLGFQVNNTGEEKDKTPYIGNINWEQALKLNSALGNVTLTPRQGLDLMFDLKKGISGKKKLYDAKGNELDSDKLKVMYGEIWRVREPWRSEWLDARFVENNGMHILYGHSLDTSGNFVHAHDDPLESCLTNDCQASLRSANSQGMLTKESNRGNFYFYYPRNGAVARFSADSDWANLDCDRDPTDSDSSLGVRPAREKN